MATGVVKWFNPEKGYGFILPDDGSPDLFVHFSAMEPVALSMLKVGQRIDYELATCNGKAKAVNLIDTLEVVTCLRSGTITPHLDKLLNKIAVESALHTHLSGPTSNEVLPLIEVPTIDSVILKPLSTELHGKVMLMLSRYRDKGLTWLKYLVVIWQRGSKYRAFEELGFANASGLTKAIQALQKALGNVVLIQGSDNKKAVDSFTANGQALAEWAAPIIARLDQVPADFGLTDGVKPPTANSG